jgi:hypothetical protein
MNEEKTYMWLTIITTVAFALAIGFALLNLNELREIMPNIANSF